MKIALALLLAYSTFLIMACPVSSNSFLSMNGVHLPFLVSSTSPHACYSWSIYILTLFAAFKSWSDINSLKRTSRNYRNVDTSLISRLRVQATSLPLFNLFGTPRTAFKDQRNLSRDYLSCSSPRVRFVTASLGSPSTVMLENFADCCSMVIQNYSNNKNTRERFRV